eukprot:TRINITY_DN682_c0_g1_i1.p1 TRINITY_DN682_c0_g1~~TRINITY_DN682_c0_g1_i1.p1  ORF type:complete len:743 (-),score=169.19 TRINITY_DN682_c0_g1_i1:2257-4239(-)
MEEIERDLAAFRLATEKYEALSMSSSSASRGPRVPVSSSSLTPIETAYEDPKERFWHIVKSPFPGRDPTVCFWHQKEQKDGLERVRGTKKTVSKNLYYKFGESIEYPVLKNAFKRAGFRPVKEGDTFNCLWGRHLSAEEYASLKKYQKTNHFPGTWAIGRKDNLYRNLYKMKRKFGTKHFDFFPESCILPYDYTLLASEMEKNPGVPWILKPYASACGRGIRVIDKLSSVGGKDKKYMAQRYLDRPLLIDGYKFDLRIYVVVTSFCPLRIYIFEDGLVRFSTQKYRRGSKSLKNRFMHLTNYSVNRKSKTFVKNTDASKDSEGSKWSIKALKRYFADHGIDDSHLWSNVEDIIIKTVICAESEVNTKISQTLQGRGTCFEMFGFDVIIDEKMKPWLLEVNILPSLSCSSPLDRRIKTAMITDLFHLVGFVPIDRKKFAREAAAKKHARLLGLDGSRRGVRRRTIGELVVSDLDELTQEEAEIIMESEEELLRARGYNRIYPTATTGKYAQFFESPRTYNLLLQRWIEEGRTYEDLFDTSVLLPTSSILSSSLSSSSSWGSTAFDERGPYMFGPLGGSDQLMAATSGSKSGRKERRDITSAKSTKSAKGSKVGSSSSTGGLGRSLGSSSSRPKMRRMKSASASVRSSGASRHIPYTGPQRG